MSTRPGQAIIPLASIFFDDFFSAALSEATRIPLRTKRLPFSSRFEAGSMMWALVIQSTDMVKVGLESFRRQRWLVREYHLSTNKEQPYVRQFRWKLVQELHCESRQLNRYLFQPRG